MSQQDLAALNLYIESLISVVTDEDQGEADPGEPPFDGAAFGQWVSDWYKFRSFALNNNDLTTPDALDPWRAQCNAWWQRGRKSGRIARPKDVQPGEWEPPEQVPPTTPGKKPPQGKPPGKTPKKKYDFDADMTPAEREAATALLDSDLSPEDCLDYAEAFKAHPKLAALFRKKAGPNRSKPWTVLWLTLAGLGAVLLLKGRK